MFILFVQHFVDGALRVVAVIVEGSPRTRDTGLIQYKIDVSGRSRIVGAVHLRETFGAVLPRQMVWNKEVLHLGVRAAAIRHQTDTKRLRGAPADLIRLQQRECGARLFDELEHRIYSGRRAPLRRNITW